MTDRIVYTVVTRPGGIDGRDHTAKGGTKFASFDREQAYKKRDAWSDVQVSVIEDVEKRTQQVLHNLSPLDFLLLQEHFQTQKR